MISILFVTENTVPSSEANERILVFYAIVAGICRISRNFLYLHGLYLCIIYICDLSDLQQLYGQGRSNYSNSFENGKIQVNKYFLNMFF